MASTSITTWLGIGLSVAALAVTAGLKLGNPGMAYLHMVIAALTVIGVAMTAQRASRDAAAHSQSRDALASSGLHYLGLVWTWGAFALFVTYAFVLQWREWWHFVLACAVLAALCLMLAGALNRDAAAGSGDATMLKLGRIVMRVHLGAMVITVIGLIADGKMVRFLTPRHHDWAAQNIFFFGAIAMAAVSWSALTALKAKP